jgi:hypothetical protein
LPAKHAKSAKKMSMNKIAAKRRKKRKSVYLRPIFHE